MSRRFGRNQRRRMRELVAASQQRAQQLEVAHEMDRGLLQHMRDKNDDLRRQLRGVARSLGEQYVHLDPMEVGDCVEHLFPPDGFPAYLPARTGSDHMVPMAITRVSAESDKLQHQVHFIARLNRESAGYAISLPALYNADEERLAQLIGESLARNLIQAIRQHKGRFM